MPSQGQLELSTSPIASGRTSYRNRRSFQLDLRTPKGVSLFKRLLGEADVMLDNFTPRVLPNLGIELRTDWRPRTRG